MTKRAYQSGTADSVVGAGGWDADVSAESCDAISSGSAIENLT